VIAKDWFNTCCSDTRKSFKSLESARQFFQVVLCFFYPGADLQLFDKNINRRVSMSVHILMH